MSLNTNWIPMRWPCGLLEVNRPASKQTPAGELKEILAAWAAPEALDLIKGTRVDCLVIPWAAGKPEDQDHQLALQPLIRAGLRMGINFVGEVDGSQGQGTAIAAGLQAGLAGFLISKLEGLPRDAPLILRPSREAVPWDSATPILSVTGNPWPGLALDTVKGDNTAQGGPTGIPWVNSNGWLSLLARQLGREKVLWLEFDPPDSSDLSHPASYGLAITDCEAYGSRWVISLDDSLRAGLTKKDPRANQVWEKLAQTLAFFEHHEDWGQYPAQGFLAVVSDFRGENEFMATEILNLLARRPVQYKVITRSEIASASLAGLKAIIWADPVSPDSEVQSKLLAFVRAGGLLISATYWGPSDSKPAAGEFSDRYEERTMGQGRIVVPKEGFKDPYEVAVDTHLILSRRNDLVRVFNATAVNAYCCADSRAGKRLVQILNYASSGSADYVVVWVRNAAPSARFWSLGSSEPTLLRGVPSRGGLEFQLPSISFYCALEFDVRGNA